jgi:hypothetical protein
MVESPYLVMTGHPGVGQSGPMAVPRERLGHIRIDTLGWPAIVLVDDLLVSYAEWRDGCDAVADAYERWSIAARSESDLRFAAFTAALDQEQTAASAYAEAGRNLKRFLPATTRA